MPNSATLPEDLGEWYLETGQLDKTEERLRVLDKACLRGREEYDDLKAGIECARQKTNEPTPPR